MAAGQEREGRSGLGPIALVPLGPQLLDHAFPRGPALPGIDAGGGDHAVMLRRPERPRAPGLPRLLAGQPAHHLGGADAGRELDQAAQQRIGRADLDRGLGLVGPDHVHLDAVRAGLFHEDPQRGLEALAILRRGEVLETGDALDLASARLHRARPGRRVVRDVGERVLHERVEVRSAHRVLERRGVQGERRLHGGRLRLGPVAAEEFLGRDARRSERQQQTFDLGAARTPLAHQGQVEDLARQVGQVERPRQPAQLGEADARVLVAGAGHQTHRHAGLLEQLGHEVRVLPVEVDQQQAAFRALG